MRTVSSGRSARSRRNRPCAFAAAYQLSLLFSLKTHRDVFAGAGSEEHGETPWPLPMALGALAVATVFIALVTEIFVGSVQRG